MDLGFLIPIGVAVVLPPVVIRIRSYGATRRRDRLQQGGAMTCRAWLRVPGSPNLKGRLTFASGRVGWRSRHSSMDLGGVVVRRMVSPAEAGMSRRARPDDVAVELLRPDGSLAYLLVDEFDVETVLPALREQAAHAPPPGATAQTFTSPEPAGLVSWWSWLCLALTVLWLVFWAWMTVIGGHHTTATVLSNKDESCRVSFLDGSVLRTTTIDCSQERSGQHRDVWATPFPLAHDAGDFAETNWVIGTVSLVLLGVAGGGVLLRIRQRRAVRALSSGTVTLRVPLPPAPLDVAELDLSAPAGRVLAQLAPHAATRLPLDGWADKKAPDGVSSARVTFRSVWLGLAAWFLPTLVIGRVASDWQPAVYLLAVPVAGVAVNLTRAWRRRPRATPGPHRPISLLLTGIESVPFILVADAAVVPAVLFAAALATPLPSGLRDLPPPWTGRAVGPLREGERPMLRVDGCPRPLLPITDLFPVGPDQLPNLVLDPTIGRSADSTSGMT